MAVNLNQMFSEWCKLNQPSFPADVTEAAQWARRFGEEAYAEGFRQGLKSAKKTELIVYKRNVVRLEKETAT